jgi:hypothetical protein
VYSLVFFAIFYELLDILLKDKNANEYLQLMELRLIQDLLFSLAWFLVSDNAEDLIHINQEVRENHF